MAKLRVLSGAAVCRIMAAHGFVEVRRRGSHMVMQRVEGEASVTVPVPNHKEIRTGTLLSRQSGIPRSEFQ